MKVYLQIICDFCYLGIRYLHITYKKVNYCHLTQTRH